MAPTFAVRQAASRQSRRVRSIVLRTLSSWSTVPLSFRSSGREESVIHVMSSLSSAVRRCAVHDPAVVVGQVMTGSSREHAQKMGEDHAHAR